MGSTASKQPTVEPPAPVQSRLQSIDRPTTPPPGPPLKVFFVSIFPTNPAHSAADSAGVRRAPNLAGAVDVQPAQSDGTGVSLAPPPPHLAADSAGVHPTPQPAQSGGDGAGAYLILPPPRPAADSAGAHFASKSAADLATPAPDAGAHPFPHTVKLLSALVYAILDDPKRSIANHFGAVLQRVCITVSRKIHHPRLQEVMEATLANVLKFMQKPNGLANLVKFHAGILSGSLTLDADVLPCFQNNSEPALPRAAVVHGDRVLLRGGAMGRQHMATPEPFAPPAFPHCGVALERMSKKDVEAAREYWKLGEECK